MYGTARLPVWLADQLVADLRRLAAQGDARAAEQLEALARLLEGERLWKSCLNGA